MARGWRFSMMMAAAACVAMHAASGPAFAQVAEGEDQEADALFQKGKTLYDQAAYDDALAVLQESDRIEPTVRSMGLIAACHEKSGRLASAYNAYRVAADRARAANDEREGFARDRALGLEPKLAAITTQMAEPPPDFTVSVDGSPVAAAKPHYVDRGSHQVVAQAPGFEPFRANIDVTDGQREVVSVPQLTPARTGEAIGDAGTAPRRPDAPADDTQLWLGWGSLGLGVVGLGLGGVFAGVALSQKSTLDEDPGCPDACGDAGAVDSYNGMRVATTTALIIGTVFAAGGVVLLLTAPDDEGAEAALVVEPLAGGGMGAFVLRY